jgi:hypothetical protein
MSFFKVAPASLVLKTILVQGGAFRHRYEHLNEGTKLRYFFVANRAPSRVSAWFGGAWECGKLNILLSTPAAEVVTLTSEYTAAFATRCYGRGEGSSGSAETPGCPRTSPSLRFL